MPEKDPKSPATTSSAYDWMLPKWKMIDALLGGTDAMRQAGEAYLPRHCEESSIAYQERLEAATLLNMTEMVLGQLAGKPFQEPVKINDDVPDAVKQLLEDVDLQGNNLSRFCRNWFREGMAKAFSPILVDFPRPQSRPDGQPRTLEDDRREALRPYWVSVRPENVIFAHAEMVGGREVLQHVRILECETVMDGFTERTIERIKVLEPGAVRIYEKRKTGRKFEWIPIDEYATSLTYIPMVVFYSSRMGTMLGKPPLMDLAHLNVTHWQSASDQRAVLTVARFPMLAGSGVDEEPGEGQSRQRIGPRQMLTTRNAQGKFYYVEHTGAAIKSGAEDLRDLEERMAGYGAEFLKRRPGNPTATARALDTSESLSPLEAMVVDFEDAVAQALWMTAQWIKLPGTEQGSGTVELSRKYTLVEPNAADLEALAAARKGRDISRKAYLDGLRRRGVLPDDFDADEDLDELEGEPSFGAASLDLDPAQEDDDPEPNAAAA